MGCLTVVGIIFVVLKLVGVIAWSWWLVLLPFIIEIGIASFIFGLVLIAFVIRFFADKKAEDRRRIMRCGR